jgi:DNA-binding SARP family transcriptional activator/tetratricopeptide (TPR) repeat protein
MWSARGLLFTGHHSTAGIMTLNKAEQIPSWSKVDTAHEPRLEIALLGEFLLRKQGAIVGLKIASHQSLLAYLVTHAGQHHTRQHLAFKFWPDSTESQALTNLRKALHILRHVLPKKECFLDITRRTVHWRTDAPCSVDVWDFETAVKQAEEAAFFEEKQTYLEEAISAYQGDFLPGYYDDWILLARESYRAKYLNALHKLILVNEDQRHYTNAITFAKKLLVEDPLDEAAYRLLMRLQSLDGNLAGALRTYHACATILQRELGVNPGQATQETYERLLQVQVSPAPLTPTRLPLIARQQAWNCLQSSWKQCMLKQSTVVFITGEAGIGKTRLAEEILDWAQRQGIITLSAACYASGGNLPYAPIADWLRAADAENLLARLPEKWLVEVSRILPELTLDRPELSQAEPITESWQRQHLFRALAFALLHQNRPILFFIDDLQWCDVDTLEWLHFFLHFDQHARFLLLGAARTEEVPDGHPLILLVQDLRQEDLLFKLDLKRLNLPDTKALAEQVTGHTMDQEQAEYLFNDTEGNPLFIVEMARAGWQEPINNHPFVALIEDQNVTKLPEKVRVVIQRRLGALSAEARDLTGLAAIIGRFFTYDLLAAASDGDETALVRALDELWQQRIIREQGTEAYDFSHDKLRQVAITSLSAARQRLLHGRVIKALESFRSAGRDVDDSRLGQHYAAVGRDAEAITCFRRAATAAQQIYAHEEALSNLRQALDLLSRMDSDGAAALGLHEHTAEVLAMMGCYEEAREALQKAVSHTSDLIDHARLLRKQGNTWLSQRHYDQAEDAYNDALKLLEQATAARSTPNWWRGLIDLQLHRGELLYFNFRLSELTELIKDLIEPITRHGQIRQERGLLNLQIMFHIARKRYLLDREDIQRAKRYLALTEEMGNENAMAEAHTELGFMYLWSDNPLLAVDELSIGLDQATEYGNIYLMDQCLAYLMLAQRRLGNEEIIQNLVIQHHPISAQAGNPNYRGVLLACEAWLSYKSGDMAAAVDKGEEAIATWGSSPYPFTYAALWPLIALALQQGRIETVMDYVGQLLDPLQRPLTDDLTGGLQEAVDAWGAGNTNVCKQHLQSAIQKAQTQNLF